MAKELSQKEVGKIIVDNGIKIRHLEQYLMNSGYVVVTEAQYDNLEVIDPNGEVP